ncbi:MAG: penicillin acylase family protein [Betaproteobacteria bacterium]
MHDTVIHELAGLLAPAEILVDRFGVSHIFAASEDDAFFAQGFTAARDRLFQMDLWRRRGLGLLADVFGPAYVEQDTATRLFLYRGDMAAEWAAYDAAGAGGAQRICERFVAGINAWIAHVDAHHSEMPWEFREFGYRPSRWRADDVVRIRSHAKVRNVGGEAARAGVIAKAGLAADAIRQQLTPAWPTTIPDGLDVDLPRGVLRAYNFATQPVLVTTASLASEDAATTFVPSSDLPLDATGGSNNWVVAPAKSATGRPILASDPHRAFSTPALRYVAHLHAPQLDVIGAGEPALPGISFGHNGTAAFGFTIFFADQEDLYVYELHPDDPTRYRYGDGWEKFRVVIESIPVRGRGSQPAALMFTRHGPIVFFEAAARPGKPRRAFAVRTVWLEPGTAPYCMSLAAMRAKDFDAFRAAAATWGTPGENLVYADTTGTIGWVAAARVPRRPNWDGLLPVPGDGRYEWDGFLRSDELPSMRDPAVQFIATANEFNLPPDYPVAERKPGFEWPPDARQRRIAEVLSGLAKVSLDDCAALQNDVVSASACAIVQCMRNAGPFIGAAESARALFGRWDGRMDADSAGAALHEWWWVRHLAAAVSATLLDDRASAVPMPDRRVIFDTLVARLQPGTSDPMVVSTLAAAWNDLSERLGADPSGWRWGALQQHRALHPLSGAMPAALQGAIDIGPLPKGGSPDTVNMASYRSDNFEQYLGPALRMILDVGAWDNSRIVSHPGQSGDSASKHYRDHVAPWQTGTYWPLLYSRVAIEAALEARIALVPKPRGVGSPATSV